MPKKKTTQPADPKPTRRKKWVTSKKYPGCRWYVHPQQGRVFYITFWRDGRYIWERVGSEAQEYNLQNAADVRAIRIAAVKKNEELPRDRGPVPTVEEFFGEYLKETAEKKSHGDDQKRFDTWIKPLLAGRKADEVGELDLKRLRRAILDKGRSKATANRVLALYRQAHNWAAGAKKFPKEIENPVDTKKLGMQQKAEDNERTTFLSPEEVQTLLDALRPVSRTAHDLALLSYHTGARAGELLGLRWGAVNTRQGLLYFHGTKTGSTRKVPMNETVRAFFGGRTRGDPEDHVFQGPRKGAALPAVPHSFKTVADRLFNEGVKDRRTRVVFHTMRHSFASELVDAGVPLSVVKELTGHSTIKMLERYLHPAKGASRAAVELLGKKPEPAQEAATGTT